MVEPPPLTVPRLLRRGLARRCPLCGGGQLFRHWVTIVDRCPRCGFRFERIEGHWIGALGINTIVSFAAVLLSVVVAFIITYEDESAWVAVGVIVATVVVVPAGLLPRVEDAVERHRPGHAARSSPRTTSTPAGSRPPRSTSAESHMPARWAWSLKRTSSQSPLRLP